MRVHGLIEVPEDGYQPNVHENEVCASKVLDHRAGETP